MNNDSFFSPKVTSMLTASLTNCSCCCCAYSCCFTNSDLVTSASLSDCSIKQQAIIIEKLLGFFGKNEGKTSCYWAIIWKF